MNDRIPYKKIKEQGKLHFIILLGFFLHHHQTHKISGYFLAISKATATYRDGVRERSLSTKARVFLVHFNLVHFLLSTLSTKARVFLFSIDKINQPRRPTITKKRSH